MYNNNLPDGCSESDPTAPWNQSDPPEQEFNLSCFMSLHKNVTVTSDQYAVDLNGDVDKSETDFTQMYCNDHITLDDVLKQCVDIFNKLSWMIIPDDIREQAEFLKSECKNWIVDDCEILNDD